MPIITYRSLHPNHVHQLMVSVSKHYYISKDGLLKYQRKPFEVTLATLGDQVRAHLVILSLRDHYSGIFFAQIAAGPALPDVYSFLRVAWSRKPDHLFHGLPELITIPRSVESAYPGLSAHVHRLSIQLVDVTSGFQGGIRDLRTIEGVLSISTNRPFVEAQSWLALSQDFKNGYKARTGTETKAELWERGLANVRDLRATWPSDA